MSLLASCCVYDPSQSINLQLNELPNQRLCSDCWKGHIIAYKDNTIHFMPIQIGNKLFYITLKAEAEKVDTTIYRGFWQYNQKNTYIVRSEDGQTNLTTDSYNKLDVLVRKIFNSQQEQK